jgi:hypothetical protein
MHDQFDQSEQPAVTRIDLWETPDGLLVVRFGNGWTASSQQITRHFNKEWTIDQAVNWLEDNNWKVRRWGLPGHAGARGWLDKMRPVRTKAEIIAKRNRMWENRHLYPDLQIHCLDFAFDM